jgi:2-polyprenyl-6-hydroxyphenyl methylase/3-demethylubiquinone-9 3-methyltransferase
MITENVNPAEIHKFGAQADDWWNPTGSFKTLHAVNPVRMQFIRAHAALADRRIVDVGCGGGILTEALAEAGGQVLGIDLAPELIAEARRHAEQQGRNIDYRNLSAEALATEADGQFDVVTCLEMLEHVPNPASVVEAVARLVKPGGRVFFSTLNRKPKAYLLAVLTAEYLLNMLPRGTHDYHAFIRPSELTTWARKAGLELAGMAGILYNPITRQFSLGRDTDVNYLAAFVRPEV